MFVVCCVCFYLLSRLFGCLCCLLCVRLDVVVVLFDC